MSKEFETECISAIKSQIVTALKQGDYTTSKPVNQALASVLSKHSAAIEKEFDDAMREIIEEKQFRETIKEQVRKSLARSIVGGMQSSCDKVVQKLKNDPVRNAMMVQAVNETLTKFEKD